jgi:hypothetical protein
MCGMVRFLDTFHWTFPELIVANGEQNAEPELPMTGFSNGSLLAATGLA